MKVGSENRRQLIVLVVLLGIASISVARMLFSWSRPSTSAEASAPVSAAPPAPAPRAQAMTVRGRRTNAPVPSTALAPNGDPRLRLDLLKYSEDMKYEGNGRNIFEAKMEEIPKTIIPVTSKNPEPPPIPIPTGPPPPPPINLKFFGFANRPGEPKSVFLSQGEDVFIAKEGEIVDRRYKLVRIQPTAVEVEDVLNNHRQTIQLTPTS